MSFDLLTCHLNVAVSPPDKRASIAPGISRLNVEQPQLPLSFHYTHFGTKAVIVWEQYDMV